MFLLFYVLSPQDQLRKNIFGLTANGHFIKPRAVL